MNTFKTTYDDPALCGDASAHDRARDLLGQVMGCVAVTVGFTALGAYLGRDLSGATGLVLFIATIPLVLALHIAAARGREQPAIGLLFGLGLAAAPPTPTMPAPTRPLCGSRPAPPRRRRRPRRVRPRHPPRPHLVGPHALPDAARPDRARDRRDLRHDSPTRTSSTRRGPRDLRRLHDLRLQSAAQHPPMPRCRSRPGFLSTL
jgi:hypothetical protein